MVYDNSFLANNSTDFAFDEQKKAGHFQPYKDTVLKFMDNQNKHYRIHTRVGENETEKYITVNLEQDYDVIDVLSLSIKTQGAYKAQTSKYGVVVGRVLANNGFGIPNAKLSLFIPKNDEINASR